MFRRHQKQTQQAIEVPESVICDPDLSPTAKLVWIGLTHALQEYLKSGDSNVVPLTAIADWIHVPIEDALSAMSELAKHALIDMIKMSKSSPSFRVEGGHETD